MKRSKNSLLAEGAGPLISKNLAEIKSIKVSSNNPNQLVLGADSVISLNNQLINKPNSREEAFEILKRLNNSIHYLNKFCLYFKKWCNGLELF